MKEELYCIECGERMFLDEEHIDLSNVKEILCQECLWQRKNDYNQIIEDLVGLEEISEY